MPGGLSFLGYERDTGHPGVRNDLLVLNLTGLTNPAARRIADGLSGARLVTMPHGSSINRLAEQTVIRTLANLARHPNVGGVLLLSADTSKTDAVLSELGNAGKPVEAVDLGDCRRDILEFSTRALRVGAHLMVDISRQRRTPVSWNQLCLALECGLSDPTSGIAANPLIGTVVDRLVAAGGSAVFGETTEWLGSEERLAERAINPDVAARVLEAVARRERSAMGGGLDLLGNNPNKANIESGLSTIEDKAIGSVAKSGTGPLSGVLEYGELAGPGLHAMDGACYTPESLTGLVAAGAQIALFATGLGNSYVSAMAPTIKLTGNKAIARSLSEQIDFDASDLVEKSADRDRMADRLIERILDIASGSLTFGEVLGEGDEIISRFGEAL